MSESVFPGFRTRSILVDGLRFHVVTGGEGPPLLLIHGAPQSHLMWRKIAPALAQRFSIVAPDLRGYGDSEKPRGGDYSKRRMASDCAAIMSACGFERFMVAGHDRGARVARRLAKDYSARVDKLAALDIAPTAHVYATANKETAEAYWHWFAYSRPAPLPEMAIGPQAAALAAVAARMAGAEDAISAAYVRCNGNEDAFHAMCQDYRAGASVDLEHDAQDAAARIACPTLILWGARSATTALFDMEAIWRREAESVRVLALDCGHFLPEEKPAETLAAFLDFFGAGLAS